MKIRKNHYWALFLIMTISILARLYFIYFEKQSPLYLFPVLDENEFLRNANYLADHAFSFPFHFWHPPAYSYFLGLLISMGMTLKQIVLFQQFLGVLSCMLLFLALYKRDFYVAFIAALIWALWPTQLYLETRFLSENLFHFLLLLLFFLLTHPPKNNKKYLLYLSVICGLLILTKSQFVLFCIALLIFFFYRHIFDRKKALLFVSLTLLLPLWSGFHNMKHSDGHFIFVSANGPVNFYIGNSKDISKTLNIRPYQWREEFFPQLFREAFPDHVLEELDSSKRYPYLLNPLFKKKTLEENKNPYTFIRNTLHKTLILFHSQETPRNHDLYEHRQWNPMLKALLWGPHLYFPLCLVFYAALIFVFVQWKRIIRDDHHLLLFLMIVCLLLPSVLFFNAFRYRLAAVPFLIVFSVHFYRQYFRHQKYQIINAVLILVLGTGLSRTILIQEIPQFETYDYYGDGFSDKKKIMKAGICYDKALQMRESEVQDVMKIKNKNTAEREPVKPTSLDGAYETYNNRAFIKEQDGQFREAIALYSKAIQLKPDYYLAYSNRGSAKFKSGDNAGAIEDYNKSIEIYDAYYLAWYGRGIIYAQLGRNDLALLDFNKAIELNPDYGRSYINRAVVRAKMEDISAAFDDVNKGILLEPDYERGYFNRGLILLNLEKPREALADFDRALKLNPGDAKTYYIRGMTRLQEDMSEGCQDLQKAIDLGLERAKKDKELYCR
jgi:tetratricopeptide (TPR) repeat protein